MREELGIGVSIIDALPGTTHSYEDFTVTLHPFTCRLSSDTITLHEHNAMLWIRPQQMADLDWAAADLPIISDYLSRHELLTAPEPA